MQQWCAEHRLIGRQSELTILQAKLEALASGSGALVLIGGEAGIGKTALARTFGEHVRAADATFTTGRCYGRSASPPFAPWQDLLADLQTTGAIDGSGFLQLGWGMALDLADDDEAIRARRWAELSQWSKRAREALRWL